MQTIVPKDSARHTEEISDGRIGYLRKGMDKTMEKIWNR